MTTPTQAALHHRKQTQQNWNHQAITTYTHQLRNNPHQLDRARQNTEQHGTCTQPHHHPDNWYPNPGDNTTANHAIQTCYNQCPVQQQCLAIALATTDTNGIQGGLTSRERRAYAKQHGITPLSKPKGRHKETR